MGPILTAPEATRGKLDKWASSAMEAVQETKFGRKRAIPHSMMKNKHGRVPSIKRGPQRAIATSFVIALTRGRHVPANRRAGACASDLGDASRVTRRWHVFFSRMFLF